MLTVCSRVAIGLTLLFRIGIRQRGAADWDATDAAHSELSAFLGTEGKTWKLADAVIERARDAVGEPGRPPQGRRLSGDPGRHEGELRQPRADDRAGLSRQARRRFLQHRALPCPPHEEAAASAGLTGFFLGAGADRTSVTTTDDEVTIKLDFSA